MNNLVSVIVPAYNVENYIEKCIHSLKCQTYQNIEIVIVEDCSTDNTYEVCKSLVEQYKDIVLLSHESNQGQEFTREDGIAVASGEWIMFLDSDDTFLSDGIEKVMLVADRYNPDWILCPYTKILKGVSEVRSCTMEDGIYSPTELSSNLFVNIPLDVLSCIGSKVYKRSFLLNNQIHFNRRFKFNEDGAYVYSCLMASEKIAVANIPFYQYWIRSSGSIQSSYRDNMFPTISNADHYLRDILIHYGCLAGGVRDGYFLRRAANMLACLENESRYRNYSGFRSAADIVRRDEDFREAYRVARSGKGSKVIQAMFLCVKYHLDYLFYAALRTKR